MDKFWAGPQRRLPPIDSYTEGWDDRDWTLASEPRIKNPSGESGGKHPLVLSQHWDIHAASVCWGLIRSGIRPIWAESLAHEAKPISLRSGTNTKWRQRGASDASKLSAVWYRRPGKPGNFPVTRPCDTQCLRQEWAQLHENLYALGDEIGKTLWINKPGSARMAENKLVQLRAARQCGLLFPETLVSNDPGEIRSFINTHGRVVYKGFSRYTWKQAATGKMFAQWVSVLSSETQLDDSSLALCPSIYQPYIEKKCDLRVTVIGNRLFTIRIRSAQGDGLVDWRRHALTEEILVDALTLPGDYERKLRLLMQRLDIVCGCIDLVVDIDGGIHFLEVNQAGQFLFVEELVESLPVLRAMCSLLATGRVDYSLEAVAKISYQKYLDSDSFKDWYRAVEKDADKTRSIADLLVE